MILLSNMINYIIYIYYKQNLKCLLLLIILFLVDLFINIFISFNKFYDQRYFVSKYLSIYL